MGSIAFRVPMENVDRKEALALLPLPDSATLQTHCSGLLQPSSLQGTGGKWVSWQRPHIWWETGLERPASLHGAAIPKGPST